MKTATMLLLLTELVAVTGCIRTEPSRDDSGAVTTATTGAGPAATTASAVTTSISGARAGAWTY